MHTLHCKLVCLLFLLFTIINTSFGQGIQRQTIVYNTPLFTNRSQIADYDRDGDEDIICHTIDPVGLIWLENTGADDWPQQTIIDESMVSLSVINDFYVADFDNNGLLDIIYTAGGNVGSTKCGIDELVILLRQPDGSSLKETIDTENGFGELAIGDFDGNGWIDIATGGENIQGVNVYLLNSYSTNTGFIFDKNKIAATSELFGDTYRFDVIETNDWEGDGDLDLLVSTTSIVWIFFNDGNGNFSLGIDVTGIDFAAELGGRRAQFVDLDKNGHVDLLTNGGFATLDLTLYKGESILNPGPFGEIPQITLAEDPIPGLTYGSAANVADFNNDGKLDIVWQVLDNITGDFVSNGGSLNILFQGNNLTFNRSYLEQNWERDNGICFNGATTEGTKISHGDLDQDGDLDIVFPEAGEYSQRLTIFENNNGTFLRKRIYAGYDVDYMTTANIIGNQDYEILALTSRVPNRTGGEIMLFDKNGKNERRLYEKWDVNPLKLAVADIDNDTDKDIVFIDNENTSLSWLKNEGKSQDWEITTIDAIVNGPRDVKVADLDNTNGIDIVVSAYDDNIVYLYQNNGSGTFTRLRLDLNIQTPFDVEIADIDKDGDLDIMVGANTYENLLVVYKNDGTGNFSKQELTTNILQLTEGETLTEANIEILDWNQDGMEDIVALFYTSNGRAVIIQFTASGNNFVEEEIYSTILSHQFLFDFQYGFIDEDNRLDLIFSGQDNGGFGNPPTNRLYTLLNTSTVKLESSDTEIGLKTLTRIDDNYDADKQSEFLFGSRYGDQRIGVIDYSGPCEANITFQNESIISGVYAANGQITTTGNVSVENGQDVALQAGESIILQPNFHVKAGATFTAQIQGCTSDNTLINPREKEKLQVQIPNRLSSAPLFINNNGKSSPFNFEIFPNPLVEEGMLAYEIKKPSNVLIEIFDLTGKKVSTVLHQKIHPSGYFQLLLWIEHLSEGMYFVRMNVNGSISSKKLMIN